MKSSIDYTKLRDTLPARVQMNIAESALERWNPSVRAAADDDIATIGIYDVIGADFWGEGVTPKRIDAALRSIGKKKPVIVNISSPGGDMFDGISIYNQLNNHEGKVTVRVMSLAASAASVIAMAGDEIQIAPSAFFMIHNAWMLGVGDRNDFRELADWLEPFDKAMNDVFSERTGIDVDEIADMSDRETWIGGKDAVEQGFADSLLAEDPETEEVENDEVSAIATLRKIEAAMVKGGRTRSEARKLLNTWKKASTHDAAGEHDTHDAVELGKVKTQTNQLRGIFSNG